MYTPRLQPFPHQQKAFEKFKDSKNFALFWEMGTGKTKTAIDIMAHKFLQKSIQKTIIFAPNSVQNQWVKDELPKHCPVKYISHIYQPKSTKKYQRELDFFLSRVPSDNELPILALHYEACQQREKFFEIIKRFTAHGEEILCIFDEGTRVKNQATKTYKNIVYILSRIKSQKILLTGTSIAKRPLDIFGMVELLIPGFFQMSYTAFQREYSVLMKQKVRILKGLTEKEILVDVVLSEKIYQRIKYDIDRMLMSSGNKIVDYKTLASKYSMLEHDIAHIHNSQTYTPYKNIDQLKSQLKNISFAIRKKDCLDLPDKVYQEVTFELNAEQKKIIDQLKKYAVAVYGDKELTIAQKQTLQLRVLQVCGGFFPCIQDSVRENMHFDVERIKGKNEKLDYIINDLAELGDEQFIVWAAFTAEQHLLYTELDKYVSICLVSGSVTLKAREDAITGFREGRYQCLVANPTVAGYGLNLQNCGYQYWYSRNFRTEARLQAEDRSHRIGICKAPVYKDLLYNCEFEKRVLENNKLGRQMNDFFNAATIDDIFAV